jgi:hypothetical protein
MPQEDHDLNPRPVRRKDVSCCWRPASAERGPDSITHSSQLLVLEKAHAGHGNGLRKCISKHAHARESGSSQASVVCLLSPPLACFLPGGHHYGQIGQAGNKVPTVMHEVTGSCLGLCRARP